MTTIWKQLRVPLLAITFGSAILVLGKLALFPVSDKLTASSFIFPEKVPLLEWQFSESRPLSAPKKETSELISQKHYRYIQNNLPLDIEMHYLNVKSTSFFEQKYASIPSYTIMRQQEGLGFYALGTKQQRAYLSACINPQGSSTFTYQQFNQNRYLYDWRPTRLWKWLLGQEPFIDRRCVWTNLSVPLQNSSDEAAYQVLEKAWFSWYQWWQPRFPKY